MPKKQINKGWIKRFDKKYFGKLEIATNGVYYFADEEVKSFISQLLKQQRQSFLKEFRKWFKSNNNELVEDAIERIFNSQK